MIPKKSLDSVLDISIILTIAAPNDNVKSISVQCVCVCKDYVKVQFGRSKKIYRMTSLIN